MLIVSRNLEASTARIHITIGHPTPCCSALHLTYLLEDLAHEASSQPDFDTSNAGGIAGSLVTNTTNVKSLEQLALP